MDPNHQSERDVASARNRRAIGAEPVDPLPPGIYPGRVSLEGPRVDLEPIDPRCHLEGLFQAGHADEKALALWTYMPYGPFADNPAMATWLRSCAGAADPVFYALRDKTTDTLAGMASFLEIRPPAGVIEIGHIWFAPPFQRTPAMTEALFLMMQHAMDYLGNRRLEWKCNALNQPSRHAALRLGFRFEGVFYNHLIPKGHSRDSAYYSILDTEWRGVRHNFERWLAVENFDEKNRQKVSLSALNEALW